MQIKRERVEHPRSRAVREKNTRLVDIVLADWLMLINIGYPDFGTDSSLCSSDRRHLEYPRNALPLQPKFPFLQRFPAEQSLALCCTDKSAEVTIE
jgi:hypothetical protein